MVDNFPKNKFGNIARLPTSFSERRGQQRRKQLGLQKPKPGARKRPHTIKKKAMAHPPKHLQRKTSDRSISLKAAATVSDSAAAPASKAGSTSWLRHLKAHKGERRLIAARTRLTLPPKKQKAEAVENGADSVDAPVPPAVARAKKELRLRLRRALRARAVENWTAAFDALDMDGDGAITLAEF